MEHATVASRSASIGRVSAGPRPGGVRSHDPGMDAVNRRTWSTREALRHYARAEGWLDAGEREAVLWAARRAADGPLLDIGVGGGRTTPLLRPLGRDYVAVDYTPALVAACRQRFPGVDVRAMDARALDFPDGHFGLAVFSFNGIDSVDLQGRERVLAEVARVLRPGGLFVFSFLNRHGPSRKQRRLGDILAGARGPRAIGRAALRAGWFWLNSAGNRTRNAAHEWAGPDVSAVNIGAHRFGVVALHTSLDEQRRQLRDAGLAPRLVLDGNSEPVPPGGECRSAAWLYVIAGKAGG